MKYQIAVWGGNNYYMATSELAYDYEYVPTLRDVIPDPDIRFDIVRKNWLEQQQIELEALLLINIAPPEARTDPVLCYRFKDDATALLFRLKFGSFL